MSVKKSKKTTRKRKPKVTLNKTGVIALSSILIGLCIVSLIVATITRTPRVNNIEKSVQAVQAEEQTDEKRNLTEKNKQPGLSQAKESIKTESIKPIDSKTSNTTQNATKTEKNQENKASQEVKKSAEVVSSQNKVVETSKTEKTQASKATVDKSAEKTGEKKATETKGSSGTASTVKKTETASISNKNIDNNTIQEAKNKKNPYNIPKATKGATLVFVIDDAGLNVENVKKYVSLPFPISIAVLPRLSHSKECAQAVRNAGKEVLLHQPMQASNLSINPGPGAITPDMSSYEIASTLKQNIAEIGPVKGINNHEGSLITENAIKMGFILDIATEEGIYFLDSRTTSQSQAKQAALERDIKIYERNAPFLDNAISKEEMLSEIYKGLAIANKNGTAIIIGHVDKSVKILPDLLKDMYPYLVEAGYRFAVPSAL